MNSKQQTLGILVVVVSLTLSGCAPAQIPIPTMTPVATVRPTLIPAVILAATETPTPIPIPTMTPAATIRPTPIPAATLAATETPTPMPHLVIGNTPFRFIGAFAGGQIWEDGYWDETVIEDYIASAKASGISVLHVMSPQYENELGFFREDLLLRMDFFFATAAKYGVYITFTFLHGLLISKPECDDPYYHPRGVEGLIKDEQLSQAFKHHIEVLLTRRNTVNGVVYRDDPTILGWMVIEDPIQNPINMPSGELPRITIPEFHDWLDDIAVYIKSVDSRHLVGIMMVSSVGLLTGEHVWIKMLDTPNLDFVEAEDTDPQDLIALNKPFIVMATTRYFGPDEEICEDFPAVVTGLEQIFTEGLDTGAAGVMIERWESDLAKIPPFEKCYRFTDSMEPIRTFLLEKANELNTPGYPFPPLDFVRISH